jgi:CRP/FNR family transcriptional regulator, cyclic AMP receptor protein
MINDTMGPGDQATTLDTALRAVDSGQRSLHEVALAELKLPSLPRKRVPAGTVIMEPETAADSLYFVIDGRIRLYRLAPTGEQVFQGDLSAGDCLKCPRVLGQHECHAFAEAIIDSTLEVLSKPLFERLRRESMAFNQTLVGEIIQQATELDQRLYESAVMPMKVRLHAELLRISRRRRDGALIISPPPTHQDLAVRIGSQREAVSKELKRLERDGVISRSRAVIHLVREDLLRNEMTEWTDDAAHDARRHGYGRSTPYPSELNGETPRPHRGAASARTGLPYGWGPP